MRADKQSQKIVPKYGGHNRKNTWLQPWDRSVDSLSLMLSQVHWSFLKKGCRLISSTPLRPNRTSLQHKHQDRLKLPPKKSTFTNLSVTSKQLIDNRTNVGTEFSAEDSSCCKTRCFQLCDWLQSMFTDNSVTHSGSNHIIESIRDTELLHSG